MRPISTFIATRTRNRLAYLREAVDSVGAQSAVDWHLLISDDASADGTEAYGRRLASGASGVEYVRHEVPLGAGENWRFGFERFRDDPAAAEFAAHLDDDNRWMPAFLAEMHAALAAHPDAAFAFCDEWVIGPDGRRDPAASDAASARFARRRLAPGRLGGGALRMAAVRGAVGINSAVIRRDALLAVGGFREAAGDLADYDLFLALADLGRPAVYVPQRLVEYRVHAVREGATYLRSIDKARCGVAIMDHYRFSGRAERLRVGRLATARATLARTLALAGEFAEARREMRAAWRLGPTRAKSAASLALLHLPAPLLRRALRKRYGPPASDGGAAWATPG